MIEDVAAKYGARVLRAAVGEANVVELMKREGAILGGEGNGGVIWPKVTYIRDSLTAMALVIGLLARTGKTVSQLVSEIPSYAIVKKKVDLPELSQAAPALAAVKQKYAARAAGGEVKIDEQDGVRIDFGSRGWLHVRASNTEPILRMIAEARTVEEAEGMVAG
jgi:phosphomannomutase